MVFITSFPFAANSPPPFCKVQNRALSGVSHPHEIGIVFSLCTFLLHIVIPFLGGYRLLVQDYPLIGAMPFLTPFFHPTRYVIVYSPQFDWLSILVFVDRAGAHCRYLFDEFRQCNDIILSGKHMQRQRNWAIYWTRAIVLTKKNPKKLQGVKRPYWLGATHLAIFGERVDFDLSIIKLEPVVRGLFQPEALTYTCPTSLPHCHTAFNKEMQLRLLCLFHLPGFGCFTRD